MKRLMYIFFAWLAMVGCKDDDTELELRISYNIADAEMVIPSSGKTTDYTILSTNTEWTITGTNEWCKVSPASGGAGTTRIYFELADNEDYTDRDVRLTLNVGGEQYPITVIQKKKDALTVTKEKHEFDQAGGVLDVKVTANVECFVKIPTSWISQQTAVPVKALDEQVLTFAVEANPSGEKRQGEIIIEDELRRFSDTIHVYQTQENQIILTANEYRVPLEGLNIDVQMKSNVEFDWSIAYEGDDEGWIHDVPRARSLSASAVQFEIDETDAERRATITFRGKNLEKPVTGTNVVEESITVIQRKMGIIVVTSERNSNVPQEGGMVEFEIEGNVEYDVEIPERANWISEMPKTKALDKNVLSLRIAANPTDQIERDACIILRAKQDVEGEIATDTVYVHQLGRARLSEYKVLMKIADAFKESKNFNANFGMWGDPNNPDDGKITADWKFVTLNEDGKVIALEFGISGLKGSLPKEIGDLEFLETLTMSYSNDLTGDIPKEIGKLKNLKKLVIRGDFNFMPDELGDLENLKSLELRCVADNEPKFLSGLMNLTELKLLCHYAGPLPAGIGKLTKLTSLTIGQATSSTTTDSYNRFTSLPDEIGNLTNLTKLYLYGGFEGAMLPATIGRLVNLATFQIQQTGFISLPNEIGNLKNVKIASWSNNKFKTIPTGIGGMENLTTIYMQNNELEGSIPDEIAGLSKLTYLQLSNNKLSGSLEVLTKVPTLTSIYLENNQFVGTIDFDWSNLSKLSTLKLMGNKFSGAIPASLWNLSALSTLDLSNNQLSGALPEKVSWSSNEKLKDVYLQENQLSGTLPEWLCSMKLSNFNVQNNNMTGQIPAKIFGEGSNNFTLSSSTFILDGNRLDGSIPESILIELLGGKRGNKWKIVNQQEGYGFDNWDYSK